MGRNSHNPRKGPPNKGPKQPRDGNGTGHPPGPAVTLRTVAEANPDELRGKIAALESKVRNIQGARAGELGQVRHAFLQAIKQLGLPNPDKLSVEKYNQMLLDPQVLAGSLIKKFAVLAKDGDFHYTPRNPDDQVERELGERMVAFLRYFKQQVQPNWHSVLLNVLSARDYGFSVSEKVWASTVDAEGNPILRGLDDPEFPGYHTIERIKLLPPESFEDNGFYANPYGQLEAAFQAFTQVHFKPEDYPGIIPAERDGHGQFRITFRGPDLDRLIVYTANQHLSPGNIYGVSDLKAAYNYWYAKKYLFDALMVFQERTSGNVVGEYANPTEQSALETALENLGVGGVLTVPKDANVRMLDGGERVVEAILRTIEYCDLMILRAMLVPNETVGGTTDASGSYARASTHLDSFVMALGQLTIELEEVIEESIIKPLITQNFGPQLVYPSFEFPEILDKDLNSIIQRFQQMVATGIADPSIDAMWMREQAGVPEEAKVPEGYVFQKPQQQPAPGAPGSPGLGLPRPDLGAQVAAAKTILTPSLVFEGVDTPRQNRLTVEGFEATALSRLHEAAGPLLDKILKDLPADASPAELQRLTITPEWIQTALDELARTVLDRVKKDVALKFTTSGHTEAARVLQEQETPGLAARLARKFRLAAAAEEDELSRAVQEYLAWAAALNQTTAEQAAAELQARLRRTVLSGYAAGLAQTEIARRVSEEFSRYTLSQAETVSRTVVMDYYNSARVTSFEATGSFVRGVKFVPLLDAATTPFCRALVGRSISRDDPLYDRIIGVGPPFFHNCRTTIAPVLADEAGHKFDTDWESWLSEHRGVDGGGFLYA